MSCACEPYNNYVCMQCQPKEDKPTTEDRLRLQCNKQESAIAVSISGKDGSVLIYVSPHCDEKEMMKSLLVAATEIAKHREENQ